MDKIPGIEKPTITSLPHVEDRISYIYLEKAKINRNDGAITSTNEDGTLYIPAGDLSLLILGPGTTITHRALELIGDAGVTVIWTGEQGVRYYASGRALTHSSSMLETQAKLFSNQRKHLDVVRKMYEMRFPGEDISKLTLQQLRGREGARVRNIYRQLSKKWNVEWNGRHYKPNDINASDPVNQALTYGNACLYGLAHSVICALGCSPGLGFVHVNHELSFVYDIADLYKAEYSIPIAFEVAASHYEKIESAVRMKCRDKFVELKLLEKMVRDIKYLLSDSSADLEKDLIYLWDNKEGTVPHGVSYKEGDK